MKKTLPFLPEDAFGIWKPASNDYWSPVNREIALFLDDILIENREIVLNKQGADVGVQYRSAIFYKTLNQKEEAEKKIKELTDKNIFKNKIVTEVSPLTEFYTAEEYHQKYFEKQPGAVYCQAIIAPALQELEKKFDDLIKK